MSTCSCNITVQTVSTIIFLIPRFVSECNDIKVKSDLPLRGNLRNDAQETTACKTIPGCPSLTTCNCPSLFRGGNLDVPVESVFLEQESTPFMMDLIKMSPQKLVLKGLNCILQCDDVPFPRDVFLDGTFFPRRGPSLQP